MDVTWICENYGDWSGDPDENPHTLIEVMNASKDDLESIQRVVETVDPPCSCGGELERVSLGGPDQ